jgi:hypothetical protein
MEGPELVDLHGRETELRFSFEDDSVGSSGNIEIALIFEGVEVFKCTHLTSLTLAMIENAYCALVDVGRSEWLEEVRADHVTATEGMLDYRKPDLRHFMICFDDGPCYEFICETVSLREGKPDAAETTRTLSSPESRGSDGTEGARAS